MAKEAASIDQVIELLAEIVDWSRSSGSRRGYFATLYRKVTVNVEAKIAQGNVFDDNERLERLDVIFANRYLNAFHHYRNDQRPTQSWTYAFRESKRWWPIVLQHLLLGMNAHINLDLGIAAARTAPGKELPKLHDDFNRINSVLASLVDEVHGDLAAIWPALRIMNRYLIGEKAIINFSMEKARDQAWSVAERLAPPREAEQGEAIAQLDHEVAKFARVIRSPGVLIGTATKMVRLGERGTVPQIIDILAKS